MSTARKATDGSTAASTLVLDPAMESAGAPEWAGALWVGALHSESLASTATVLLQRSAGYTRARLLIREGAALRGFVELDAPGGVLKRADVDRAIAKLPPAAPTPSAAALPSITVIVCTRDRAPLLRDALAALLRLDYPDFDVLVVDNASRTTATSDLVREEFGDPRVTLVSEPVAGKSRALNKGLRHARGEIVAYTDDDVSVDAGWLRQVAAGFERAGDVACVTGLVPSGEVRTRAQAYFDDRVSWSKNVEPRVYSLAAPPADLPIFPFSIAEFGAGANFALRRSLVEGLGGFDIALGPGTRTGGGEDIDMFTRVILAGHSLVVQPSAIVWHRHRDDLAALRVQARGYGIGRGAWITKVMTNPRTARMALARSPRAIGRLVSIARPPQVGRGAAEPTAAEPDEWDRQLARVGRLELMSVALGPVNYLRERLSREGRAG